MKNTLLLVTAALAGLAAGQATAKSANPGSPATLAEGTAHGCSAAGCSGKNGCSNKPTATPTPAPTPQSSN